jgi:hypothetical protein
MSINLDKPREILTGMMKTQFAARFPDVPIKYENQKFTEPRDKVAICVVPGMTDRAEISSSGLIFGYGICNITVLLPEDKGTKTGNEITQALWDIFGDKQVGYPEGVLNLFGMDQRVRGMINGFYVTNVLFEYRLEARRAPTN